MKSPTELKYAEIRHLIGSSCKMPAHLTAHEVATILFILEGKDALKTEFVSGFKMGQYNLYSEDHAWEKFSTFIEAQYSDLK